MNKRMNKAFIDNNERGVFVLAAAYNHAAEVMSAIVETYKSNDISVKKTSIEFKPVIGQFDKNASAMSAGFARGSSKSMYELSKAVVIANRSLNEAENSVYGWKVTYSVRVGGKKSKLEKYYEYIPRAAAWLRHSRKLALSPVTLKRWREKNCDNTKYVNRNPNYMNLIDDSFKKSGIIIEEVQ